jgi:predicted Zn-dependent peptidase
MPSTPVKPVWVDFNKDMQKSKVGAAEVLYVKNNDNSIFRLRYRYHVGSWHNKKLGVAAQYLQFLGTPSMSSEQFTKEFYKIACSFNVSAGSEFTVVTIEGLQENFDKAVSLFETLIANCQPDEEALKSMKARVKKSRTDAKANKGAILNGLTLYARYGAKNPFNYTMSNEEIDNMTAKELTDLLHELGQHKHEIMYYGPQPMEKLSGALSKMHPVPASFRAAPPKQEFLFAQQTSNKVYFTDYNMVQAEIRWIRNNEKYDPSEETLINLFNNYFGGGMSTLVFQTIRESKALAYSTFAYYIVPDRKEDPFSMIAYVGCQSDKFNESITAMNELLTSLPENPKNIESAKSEIKNNIETDRIVQDAIIFDYIAAQRKGWNKDYRKEMYENIDKLGYNDLKSFHAAHISGKPFNYAILASEKKVKMEDMNKLGEVTKLSLEQIFGY